jgi:hypothetical protein
MLLPTTGTLFSGYLTINMKHLIVTAESDTFSKSYLMSYDEAQLLADKAGGSLRVDITHPDSLEVIDADDVIKEFEDNGWF